jgi:Cu+-exporting ATPase
LADTVVLDKMGTVTAGRMALVGVQPAPGESRTEILRLAATVEHAAEHPIALAVATAGRDEACPAGLPEAVDFRALPGLGARSMVDGHDVVVGRSALLRDLGIEAPDGTGVAVAWDGQYRGALTVADAVRPTSAEAVRRMRALGLRPVLLTGTPRRPPPRWPARSASTRSSPACYRRARWPPCGGFGTRAHVVASGRWGQ